MMNAIAQAGVMTLRDFLENRSHILVLSGAGISTASGIPDYRDQAGVLRGKSPVQGPDFRRTPAVQKRYWARSMVGWPLLAQAQPNAAHHAIAALQANGRLAGVITQNVDGLHQRAGSVDVVELHGNIHAVKCLACAAYFPRELIQSWLEDRNPAFAAAGVSALPAPDGDAHVEAERLADFDIPPCPRCGGMLTPDVVFFGDGVPTARTAAAEEKLQQADALLVVGSSLMVYSGYRLCKLAAASGTPIAAINRGKTRADDLLSFKTEEPAEQVLPLLAQWLGPC
jgi:NAD-dependent SIR2 family protein deacetylase